MSFTDLLIDSFDVLRYTSTPDGYGQPIKSWAVNSSANLGRLTTPRNVEVQRDLEVVIAEKSLHCFDTVDVTEQDRILCGGITYEILSVASYRGSQLDNKTLMLKVVK
jgi:hypothetical protein